MAVLPVVAVAVACAVGAAAVPSPKLKWAPPITLNRSVDIGQLEVTLKESLQGVDGGSETLRQVMQAMNPTFQVLPKMKDGGLSHSATTYLVHEYFTRHFQWHIRGMGPDAHNMKPNVAPLHEASILQDKAPELVENLLRARENGHGLTIKDAAAMATTLHTLVRQDAVTLLEKAYELLGYPLLHRIAGRQLIETILAFAYTAGGQTQHPKEFFWQRIAKPSQFMLQFALNSVNIAETLAFQQRHRSNPFIPRTYGFDDLLDIIQRVLEEFGFWQDASCRTMKQHLIRLDPKGAGRVPLGLFYAQPDMGSYRFSESIEYLRQTGALDESIKETPQILMSNYILGPGNCFSSSTYFQFCCINDCSSLMAAIEARVTDSEVEPLLLIDTVANASFEVTTEPSDEKIQFSQPLVEKLHQVAARHGGKVPIHGRLFAQWLHFAFPKECPYPHLPVDQPSNGALTASDFSVAADPEEMQRHIAASGGQSSEPSLAQWTDDELLSLLDPPSESNFRIYLRIFAIGLAFSATAATLFKNVKVAEAQQKTAHEFDKVI
jgi:hypothetical protein